MKDYISVDLETTGFSPLNSDIIEIGAWKVKGGVVVDKFCTLVRPVMYIPRTVQELTGITMEDVKDCELVEPVLSEFHSWCEGLPFLGHNLVFDYDFLCYKGKYAGLDFTLNNQRTGIDTLSLSKKILSLQSNKLEEVAKHFNICIDAEKSGYHRAGYDAYITKLIYDRFLLMHKGVDGVDIPHILRLNDNKYGKVTNNDTLSFT